MDINSWCTRGMAGDRVVLDFLFLLHQGKRKGKKGVPVLEEQRTFIRFTHVGKPQAKFIFIFPEDG